MFNYVFEDEGVNTENYVSLHWFVFPGQETNMHLSPYKNDSTDAHCMLLSDYIAEFSFII